KVEDNPAVRTWSEATQHEKGNSLAEGYVDKRLFRVLAQFWNATYSCFTFEKVDLISTVEEYTALLWCPKIQVDRAYSRAVSVPTFLNIILTHPDTKKKVDVFALSIYGLVVFP
ncbi:hypothetical protein Godav_011570, partial [Gossypium davidsonii]|nr:hypothetical protein [Gossypium davidsonii]